MMNTKKPANYRLLYKFMKMLFSGLLSVAHFSHLETFISHLAVIIFGHAFMVY